MIPQAWKENKPKIMRRIVFFFLILGFGVLQNSGVLPDFFGLKFLPLLPLTVTVGMFERETYGLSFGLLAGPSKLPRKNPNCLRNTAAQGRVVSLGSLCLCCGR